MTDIRHLVVEQRNRLGDLAETFDDVELEAVIHGYDIAWSLGRNIEVPAASLVIVADTCRRTGLFLRAKQRSAGLTLRANDIDWSAGSGPEVAGPLASIVMAITGRPAGLADLTGAGLATLRSWVA